MADRLKEPEEGDSVQLQGPCGTDWFLVIKDRDKVSIRVQDKTGGCFLAHKTRIVAIAKKGSDLPRTEGQAEANEKEETVPSETAVAEKPATKAAKPAAVKKQAKKETPEPKPFDLNAFVKEHGGVHLSKPSEFDHDEYKVTSHMCVDEKLGFYFTFNTYLYPSGVMSRGKKDQGGNSYPLKGHRHTVEKTTKKGQLVKEVHKGTKTGEEVVAVYEKKGYKRAEKPARSARSSATMAAVKSNSNMAAVKIPTAAAPAPAPVPVTPAPAPVAAASVAPVVAPVQAAQESVSNTK